MKVIVTGPRRSGKSRLIRALTALQPDLPRVRLSPALEGTLGFPHGLIRYTSEDRHVLPEAAEATENWIAEMDPAPIDFSEFEAKHGILVICCVSEHVELRIKENNPEFKRNEDYPMMLVVPDLDSQIEVSALNILAWLKQGLERKLAFFNASIKEWHIRDPELEVREAGWHEEEPGKLKVMMSRNRYAVAGAAVVMDYFVIDLVNRPKYVHSWLV